MTFGTLTLAGIIGAIAIPALVILYFLKLRRQPKEVSTTLLWKKAIQDLQANAPFQRLRKNILLLLQLLALILLIFALAQPRTERETEGGQRIVLMLDRSASMASLDGDPERPGWTRLDEAKRRAIELVETLAEPGVFERGESDEAMVVAFDGAAEIVQPFTSDKRTLTDAIRSVFETDAPTSIDEAYRLSQAQRPTRTLNDNAGGTTEGTTIEVEGLRGGPAYTFHLFSDGRIPDAEVFQADTEQGDTPTFEYHAVGDPAKSNIAITALRSERAFDDPASLTVFVGVQSTHAVPVTVDVELQVDGMLASVRPVTIAPAQRPQPGVTSPAQPGTGGVVFELREPGAIRVDVRLVSLPEVEGSVVPGNVLDADDAGTLIVPPAKQASVALVTRGSLFLQGALESLPLSRFEVLSPGEYASRRAVGAMAAFDLVVFDRMLPEPDGSGTVLDPGRYLLFGVVPPESLGVERLGASESGSQIIDWRRSHPVLRDLTLDGLVMAGINPMRIPDDSGAVSIAETPEGPAIVEFSEGTVRGIAASFDVGQTNWPFQVGFLVYLGSAVEYLTATGAEPEDAGSRQILPGGVLSDRVPTDATDVRVVLPRGGRAEVVPDADGRVVYGPIRQRGLYKLEWRGSAGATDTVEGSRVSRIFSANLLDPLESDTTPANTLGLADRVVSARSDARGGVLELWPFVVLAALAVMLFEWWVYNRRVSL